MAENEPDYSLVMPFISVASAGGSHDDESYVCGYEMGHLHAYLEEVKPACYEATLNAANTRQADLIAMHTGYRLTVEDLSPEFPEWVRATFTECIPPDGEAGR